MRYVNGTRLDDRIIRTDWDTGFIEGRQYGRGKSGGQIRDEYRTDYDDGRGGFGMTRDVDTCPLSAFRSAGKNMTDNMRREGYAPMDD